MWCGFTFLEHALCSLFILAVLGPTNEVACVHLQLLLLGDVYHLPDVTQQHLGSVLADEVHLIAGRSCQSLQPYYFYSSKETVEVISLLSFSDQTDPFNRSPLTMDQIRPNTELKEKIQQWLAERKKQKEDLEDTLN